MFSGLSTNTVLSLLAGTSLGIVDTIGFVFMLQYFIGKPRFNSTLFIVVAEGVRLLILALIAVPVVLSIDLKTFPFVAAALTLSLFGKSIVILFPAMAGKKRCAHAE